MKVLHLFNTAGIAQQLIKYSNEKGVKSELITNTKGNVYHHYKGKTINDMRLFYLISMIKSFNYDVVIVHGHLRIIPYISMIGADVILYAHGSELRIRNDEYSKIKKYLKGIIVSTVDLLQLTENESAIHIPNPVDNMFKDFNEKRNGKAFTFSYNADKEAIELSKQYNLELDILKRQYNYYYMPHLLNQYSYYIDVKKDENGNSLITPNVSSLTGLEALACGTKVITESGIKEELPKIHRIEYSGEKFLRYIGECSSYESHY